MTTAPKLPFRGFSADEPFDLEALSKQEGHKYFKETKRQLKEVVAQPTPDQKMQHRVSVEAQKRRMHTDYAKQLAGKDGLGIVPLGFALTAHEPPSYVISGFLPRNKIFACTAPKGSHKTDLLILLALHVANADDLTEAHPIHKPGKVLIMAGENPDDLLNRIRAVIWKFDYPARVLQQIHVVQGAFDLSTGKVNKKSVFNDTYKDQKYDLILMDTAQAYGPRDDSNNNAVMLNYAHTARSLTSLGNPAVLILAHPTKADAKARGGEFEPYGGGAFINEIDGLCSLEKKGERVTLTRNNKWRGKPWEQITFKAGVVSDCPTLVFAQEGADGDWIYEQETAPFLRVLSPEDAEDENEGATAEPEINLAGIRQRALYQSLMDLYYRDEVAGTPEEERWYTREQIVDGAAAAFLPDDPPENKKQNQTLKKLKEDRGDLIRVKNPRDDAAKWLYQPKLRSQPN